jgi:hypothetical protein
LTNCSQKREVANGTYQAFFYETEWTLDIADDKFTYLSSGHLGTGRPVSGNYKVVGDTLILLTDSLSYHNKFLIDGDSCLIEVEMQTDYCIRRPDIWGSRWRDINYPQIKTTDANTKKAVLWMLETTLNSKQILEYFPDTTKSIVIQEYAELNKLADLNLKSYGKRIMFLTEDEIKKLGIDEYLIPSEIRVGTRSAMINFQIMPEFSHSLLEFFEKQNGKWTHLKR